MVCLHGPAEAAGFEHPRASEIREEDSGEIYDNALNRLRMVKQELTEH